MKKVFWIIVTIIILFVLLATCSKNSNTDKDVWAPNTYKDEFGTDTGIPYNATNYIKGTFSDSTMKNEDAYLKIFIDNDRIYIMLWKYDTDRQNFEAHTVDEFIVTVLDSNGEKHYFNSTINDKGEISLEDRAFIELIQNNESIKIHIQSVDYYNYSFLFTVERDNFDSVYKTFTTPDDE